MFFYLCKVLFSDFLQFNGNFVDAQNNSEYRDWAPLKTLDKITNCWRALARQLPILYNRESGECKIGDLRSKFTFNIRALLNV